MSLEGHGRSTKITVITFAPGDSEN